MISASKAYRYITTLTIILILLLIFDSEISVRAGHSLPLLSVSGDPGKKSFNGTADVAQTGTNTFPQLWDIRSTNYALPVRNQGSNDVCWAFATYGGLETMLRKTTGRICDFSEEHMRFFTSNDVNQVGKGLGNYYRGPDNSGNFYTSLNYLTNWDGPVNEYEVPYTPFHDALWPVNMNTVKTRKWVTDVKYVPATQKDIKENIMEYGSVYTDLWLGNEVTKSPDNQYYDTTHNALYYTGTENNNHAACIVGWDDNYKVTNFTKRPPGKGAWLIRNSWGEWGDNGYFWVSYYDNGLAVLDYSTNGKAASVMTITKAVDPDNNVRMYSHDRMCNLMWGYKSSASYVGYANVFDIQEQEEYSISNIMVHVGFASGDYRIYIRPALEDGTPPLIKSLGTPNQTGKITHEGYTTITLQQPVKVKNGKYAVIVQFANSNKEGTFIATENNQVNNANVVVNSGESFNTYVSDSWEDTGKKYGQNISIRAVLTKDNKYMLHSQATKKYFVYENNDISVPIDFNGNTISSITNGNEVLYENTDYIINPGSVLLTKRYIERMKSYTGVLDFKFTSGNDQWIYIGSMPTPTPEPQKTPVPQETQNVQPMPSEKPAAAVRNITPKKVTRKTKKITGTVTKRSTVKLMYNAKTIKKTTASSKGSFMLKNLNLKRYKNKTVKLVISKKGYKTMTKSFRKL